MHRAIREHLRKFLHGALLRGKSFQRLANAALQRRVFQQPLDAVGNRFRRKITEHAGFAVLDLLDGAGCARRDDGRARPASPRR